MILTYSDFIYLIANIFRVFSINLFLETIFLKKNLRCSQELKNVIFILYYILNSSIYLRYQIPMVTVLSNLILFLCLTLPYNSTIYKRIFVVCCIFLLGILCETIVSRTAILILGYTDSIKVITYTLSNFLFYIVILLVKSMIGQEDRIYQKERWAVLIMIPVISAVTDIMLLYGGYEQWITVAVLFCLFMINIAFFYLYQIIVSNYEIEMQNQSLMLQNKAYQQQLDMIHATEERLTRAKHDFKNHLIILEGLIRVDEKEELKEYFHKMDQEYQLSEDYIYTGNKILDGLINNKLKIMKTTGASIEMNIQIPEKMEVNAFDLVIVIGNLLDNAMEALNQQECGSFYLEISYKKGMLFIYVWNTYEGELLKKGDMMISTKKKSNEPHGIGLSNIRRVVEQYHGDMIIHTENNIFSVRIIIYV